MTVPLRTQHDMRETGARGVPRAEAARGLGVSRNTVSRYADMADMPPAPPLPAPRARPSLEGHEARGDSVLSGDLGAPRKQRHTARRICDRLVAERVPGDAEVDVAARRIAAGEPVRGGAGLSVYDALSRGEAS